MRYNKTSITFLGDSIMKYKNNSPKSNWLDIVIKKLIKKFNKKLMIYSKHAVGLNSRGLLNLISDYFLKIKVKNILVVQIGINDSWHYRSLGGIPEVSLSAYKMNLNDLFKKSKVAGFKKIIFINYHKLLNDRMEANKKSLNYNLNLYNKVLIKFCKKKKLKIINIRNSKFIPQKFCLPMPDGVHLNNHGAKFYSNVIFKEISKLLNEKKI